MEPTARANEDFRDAVTGPRSRSSTALSASQEFDPATATNFTHRPFRTTSNSACCRSFCAGSGRGAGRRAGDHRVNYLPAPGMLASGEISGGSELSRRIAGQRQEEKTVRRIRAKLLRADAESGKLTLDEYCAAATRHRLLRRRSQRLCRYRAGQDRALPPSGARGPQFNGLGSLLAGTDILTTVPDYTAQILAASGGLRIEDHPVELPPGSSPWPGAAPKTMIRQRNGCARASPCSSAMRNRHRKLLVSLSHHSLSIITFTPFYSHLRQYARMFPRY